MRRRWSLHLPLVALAAVAALGTACSSSDQPSPSDLVGTWEAGSGIQWEVSDSVVSASAGGGLIADSDYTASATQLELVDTTGPFVCPSSQTGTYEWSIVDDELSLQLVTDACEGRNEALDGTTFARVD